MVFSSTACRSVSSVCRLQFMTDIFRLITFLQDFHDCQMKPFHDNNNFYNLLQVSEYDANDVCAAYLLFPNPTYLLTFLPKEHLKKFIFSFFPVKLWKQLLLLLLTVEHLLMRVHLPTYLPATLSRKPNCLFLQQNFT